MSALIFVAVAVAWAVYLVPKALRHHEEDDASRTVDQVSDRVRVLARRDAVSARATALVAPGRPDAGSSDVDEAGTTDLEAVAEEVVERVAEEVAEQVAPAEVELIEAELEVERVEVELKVAAAELAKAVRTAPQRAAARRAARRRRRVLAVLLTAVAIVIGLAVAEVVAWPWVAAPSVVVVAWLVLCRVMVRRERAIRRTRAIHPATRGAALAAALDAERVGEEPEAAAEVERDPTGEIAVVAEADAAPEGTWQPVPMTLPTYVGKATVGRTVRTIDLDSTGVWTSGRKEEDSLLAREAEAQDRASRAPRATGGEAETERRAMGS
ncbi:hypothetical protein E8D34_04700 [Nocardioides sp. GY 10113]|uniref:divisome protein SepX/GlpR n=1 Tax=Nocardioides sp. GY 10113 TaxID=2569761 RepID=UPI0010A8DABC|nr:hypothetical protein [Nocardioides sp. GY 10113]TIC88243.1 hypothetical protein E8D34_04700 [Nocardioides sp. GY 10113]